MNESTLTQLKILVERAVRPVQASIARKRKMREELLAHVSGVFEEELARLDNERSALEQTELRFGTPCEVTCQLQESVPPSDGFRRWWEGPAEESAMRVALRLAWVSGTLAVFTFLVAWFATRSIRPLPVEAAVLCLCGVLALPVYLFGLAFLTDWMEKALYGPTRSRFKIALVAGASWLFMNLWCAGLAWPTWLSEFNYPTAILWSAWVTPMALLFPYALARQSVDRMRYHEEWARLDIG
jgi:hypothetical protein